MTRAAAEKTAAAADALLDWLRTQPPPAVRRPPESPAAISGAPAVARAAGLPGNDAGAGYPVAGDPLPVAPEPGILEPTDRQPPDPSERAKRAKVPPAAAGGMRAEGARRPDQGQAERSTPQHPPLRLAHTDWLHHRLSIAGPQEAVAAFRDVAAGAGIIPWHLDLDRIEEDSFLRLVAPPPPHQRTLSLAGARILASQLRAAVARRHALAIARVGRGARGTHSRACPFDLHALAPVPEAVLRLGPDDPDSVAWLWEHWGTTQALRHVAEDTNAGAAERRRAKSGEGVFHLTFWSADWTPWRALAQCAARWPALRFETRPTYDAP